MHQGQYISSADGLMDTDRQMDEMSDFINMLIAA